MTTGRMTDWSSHNDFEKQQQQQQHMHTSLSDEAYELLHYQE